MREYKGSWRIELQQLDYSLGDGATSGFARFAFLDSFWSSSCTTTFLFFSFFGFPASDLDSALDLGGSGATAFVSDTTSERFPFSHKYDSQLS